jgi:hypothetical protein
MAPDQFTLSCDACGVPISPGQRRFAHQPGRPRRDAALFCSPTCRDATPPARLPEGQRAQQRAEQAQLLRLLAEERAFQAACSAYHEWLQTQPPEPDWWPHRTRAAPAPRRPRPTPLPPDELAAAVRAAWDAGHTTGVIAKRFGVRVNFVLHIIFPPRDA